MNDKVMVVTPTYCTKDNERLPLLLQSMHAVARQTYGNVTHVIVDDGSTDKTPELLEKIAYDNPRIRVYHKENGGSSSAVNFGVNNALREEDFKYITITHSDDLLFPKSIEDRVRAIERDKSEMVYSDMLIFNGKNDDVRISRAQKFSDSESLYRSLKSQGYIPYPTMLWKTPFFTNKLGGYDERITSAEDWDIALRSAQEIYRLGGGHSIAPSVTVAYRCHENNLAKTNLRDGTRWGCYKMILGKHMNGLDYNIALAKAGTRILCALLPESAKSPLRTVRDYLLHHSSQTPFINPRLVDFLKEINSNPSMKLES